MSAPTSKPRSRTWSLLEMPWRWSVISTPILAALTLYTLGALLDVLNVHVLYVAPVALFALFGTVTAVRRTDLGSFPRTYAITVVALAGLWLIWTSGTTAWSKTAVTVLACGLGLFGPLWFLARHSEHRKRMREEDERRRQLAAAEARRWPDLLAMLGMPGVVQRDRIEHSHGCYTLRLLLPVDGKVKYATLRNKTEEIEIAAGLRYGAIYVERGQTAAEVWLHVNEVDILSKTIPLPRDNAPLTINEPLPLGVYEDSTTLEVPMQGRASKTVGLRGKGKSNLINVKTAAFTRCVDVVVWMIDGKGGRTARPWLQPWFEGRTHRPVIDWVATNQAEVDKMLRAAEAVIDYRANSAAGGDKITPTPQLPEIMILCEEVALIFGQHDVSNAANARRGLKIVQLGRSEAVSVDLVAQRGTVTMLGSGDLKSQLENTFGLGVADANDARYIFGDTKIAADLAKLEHPGAMLVQAGLDTRILPAKAWWVAYEEIGGPGGIAERNTYLGLDLDAGSAAAAQAAGGYYSRWSPERSSHLVPGAKPQPRQTYAPPSEPTTAEKLGLEPSKLIPSPFRRDEGRPDLHLVEGSKPDVPPVLAAVHEVFKASGADRLHTTRLLANSRLAGLSGKRLGMLLTACGVQPHSEPFWENGERGRGYHYSDIAAAVQRINDGRVKPPDYAYGWDGPAENGPNDP
ncbi:hypothetical protein [Flindersiella endophytica]